MLRMIFRRRITLFWSLLFPMILMTLLGLLFGQPIDAGTIAVARTTDSAAATQVVDALDAHQGRDSQDRTRPRRTRASR